MAERRGLKVSIENFGPVREGEFELKPLTLFIGPNNSGKSYMALLVYAFSQALSGRLHRPFFRLGRYFESEYFEKHSGELEEWLGAAYRLKKGEQKDLLFKDLSQNIQQIFQEGFDKIFSALREDLEEALRDYFGCEDVKDLVRAGETQKSLSVRLNEWEGGPPFLSFWLRSSNEKGVVKWSLPDMSSLRVPFSEIMRIMSAVPPPILRERIPIESLLQPLWTGFWLGLLKANGIPQQGTYYLPAARFGILQGGQVFASMAVQIVRQRLGLERIEMPAFAGVAGDFLQLLLEKFPYPQRQRVREEMRPALQILEGQILRGEVSVEEKRPERPLILYKSSGLRLPLQRVSSMVGELAPLDLWIKYLLDPGDLLIIDEPEAHVHPEGQRWIARVLVRLARAGVRVLCTTHSSLILHQVSNHLLASEKDPKDREKLGFTEDDLLKGEEVGVYLFEMRKNGTHIKPVLPEPGFGIPEEEFVRVAEAIGDETYRLSVSSPMGKGASS